MKTKPVFLSACAREPVPHTPIWIMRQAGRYLPEYRAVREKVDFLTLTKTPDLAAEVTLQPMRRFGMDAAILFSDIMTPLGGMGIDVEFKPAPFIDNPIDTADKVEALRPIQPAEDVPYVLEAVKTIRGELPADKALIGFAGAPFTLFCYAVTGKPDQNFPRARAFLYEEAAAAKRLLSKLGDAMGAYWAAQADAGADALMLFESWGGLLSADLYQEYALPAVEKVLAAVRPKNVPLIFFANQGAAYLSVLRDLPVDVIAVDWRQPLSEVSRIVGREKTLQGNLDPAALFGPPEELGRRAKEVLNDAADLPGHIFNLGHGIWPQTDPDAVGRLVDFVHEQSAR